MMRRLRIKGLVSLADAVRRELAAQITTERRTELRDVVHRSLREVDRIAARHGTTIHALSSRSRRAYLFLASLDFAKLPSQRTPRPTPPPGGNVALTGIKAYLDQVCLLLAAPPCGDKADELHESIRSASKNIEEYLQENKLSGRDLTPQSHSIRGWMAFFAERENFNAYVSAVTRARSAFERTIDEHARFSRPARIEFRPTRGLYRICGDRNETRIVLAAPMICFTGRLFLSVASAAIHGRSKQGMVQAASGEEYQGIQAELQALGGVEEETAGVHRDLEASFRRVVGAYFGADFPRPRLAWSHSFTGRKFGHYDSVGDAVMISCTLDRVDVPEFVLDSVMHHELLHKKLGIRWHNGRMNAHSPEFRREEQRFTRYREADLILERLAEEC